MNERTDYQDKRDWIVVARLGDEISARSAAARLSAVDKAERDGLPCPDVRVLEREWLPGQAHSTPA